MKLDNKYAQKTYDVSVAERVGTEIGINWDTVQFSPSDLYSGMKVEEEHGPRDPETDVTRGDLTLTAKIAWAHLKESPDYYKYLEKMEESF